MRLKVEINGGYIDIYKDFTVNGVSYRIGDGKTGVYVSAYGYYVKYPTNIGNANNLGQLKSNYSIEDKGDFIRVYGWFPNIEYTIYLAHECDGKWAYVEAKTLMLNGIDGYDLYVGSKLLPCSKLNDGVSIDESYCSGNTMKGWAARHALFRQSDDDTSVFTNNLFAMKDDKFTNTVIFGQPELPNGSLENGIFCEFDNFAFEGDVSNNSIKYTWGHRATRSNFYKIGVYGTITTSIGRMWTVGSIVNNGNGSKTLTFTTKRTYIQRAWRLCW